MQVLASCRLQECRGRVVAAIVLLTCWGTYLRAALNRACDAPQVEAIAWRVKKSLLLHWLTCGIYSTQQSGGSQGFWKGLKEDLATFFGYPEAAESKKLREPSHEAAR